MKRYFFIYLAEKRGWGKIEGFQKVKKIMDEILRKITKNTETTNKNFIRKLEEKWSSQIWSAKVWKQNSTKKGNFWLIEDSFIVGIWPIEPTLLQTNLQISLKLPIWYLFR